jgi:hypothetical protein
MHFPLRAAAYAGCRDPQKLLMRCAHAAEVHPRRSATIIIFGGFSRNTDPTFKDANNMTDELLLLHTDRSAHLQLGQHRVMCSHLQPWYFIASKESNSSLLVWQAGRQERLHLSAVFLQKASPSLAGLRRRT